MCVCVCVCVCVCSLGSPMGLSPRLPSGEMAGPWPPGWVRWLRARPRAFAARERSQTGKGTAHTLIGCWATPSLPAGLMSVCSASVPEALGIFWASDLGPR